MSAAVVFILFVICLVIAIPVSISLGIVAVLPGAFDSSFTASASYVIRSMLGGIDSFPLLAVPMFVLAGIVMAHGKISQKLFDVFVYFIGKRTAGIIPGLLIGALLMFYAYYHCKRYGEDKEKINAKVSELRSKGLFSILKDSIWALLSPVIVLGCIYAGIASPTEAAVISVFYALFVSLFIYKSIKVKEIWGIMVEAMKTYAPILFILAASTAFSRVLTLMQVPQTVSAWILAHFTNEIVLLIVINIFLLIVGMVMDTTPAILILSPILLPIVQSIGMNPIHFGVVMIVNLAIGFVTPPIGVNLFVASSLTDVPVMRIAKKAAPMIGYFLLALLLLTFIPAISLCLL
ncbi:MAG: TRAP transporter large permease [[Eubacterium] rectale]|nr:TRAP transporter large permease [Agathobacter rectalis]